ncbi:MAG: lipoyl(octanoyl) transferase LipB [gamma proteobacterium symbiont of Bathyaustriella thionipta]|nr:lipoyl(octanoyl) transferase LipB [gamma proteobacterium symbiont of Bathyaustriella thionipta]
MRAFTDSRSPSTEDEIWCLQHHPVFTQGQAGKAEHILHSGPIPVVQSDRGGQVTYHGPGQLISYTLIDLKRLNMGIRPFVSLLENSVIQLLSHLGIESRARADAPGVYVQEHKIAALGLRVRQGRCYHGISLNVHMDLSPFQRINPCGHAGMPVTDLHTLGIDLDVEQAGRDLYAVICQQSCWQQHKP